MINVTRRSYIENATPEEVFAALSDPKTLTTLLPRVQKVEMLDQQASSARLITHMGLGGIFGTIRCEGDLSWVEPKEILFQVRKPLPVETRWLLVPAVNGTDLQATMSLNLTPLLGPMAQFVPTDAVADMIAKELEGTLASIARRMSTISFQAHAAAA
ncbi:MAG: SRPBCC family protein [Chloroflexaceae bacterium]|jgi:carbon monoxide dehydrogenase subunit G|nr:SRPBCC family protein [Chloroflexaceae bacterium]